MRRLLAVFALAVALAPLGARPAQAQPWVYQRPVYGRGYRPLLSPYLNLLRNNGDPAINYYLGTITEGQRRQNDYLFRTDIGELEARTSRPVDEKPGDTPPGLPPTGQPVAFGNTRGQFNSTQKYFPPVSLPPGVVRRTVTFR